tara:strand:- start:27260 stop:27934 length:675 start_codon:yes stop_codon:yes gene_type:complete
MVQLLSIDCIDKLSSFAHAIDGEIISYSEFKHDSLSAELLNNLNRFLLENKIDINDFDVFAVCNGPGGYTSLRVAIATIQGIASSLNKKVQAVSKLAANAYAAIQIQNEYQNIISFHKIRDSHYIFKQYDEASILDAKNEEVFIEFTESAIKQFPKNAIICGDIPRELPKMIDSKLINGQYKILEQATKDARIIAGLAFARKIYYEPYELNVLYPLPPKIHKKK